MKNLRRRIRVRLWGSAFWLAAISWGVLAVVILTDPDVFADYYYLPIWPAMFLALAATSRLILGNWRRGLIFGLAGTIYMVFRYLGIGEWIYGVLLLGLSVTVERYLNFQKTQNTQRARMSEKPENQRFRRF